MKYSQQMPCALLVRAVKYTALLKRGLDSSVVLLSVALLSIWCVGILGRGYWTPDEPREADIAWRMSWQPDKAVPLLAGEAFCEKPPLTYWAAAAAIKRVRRQAPGRHACPICCTR